MSSFNFSDIKTNLGNLCLPAKIYLGFAVITYIFISVGSFSILSLLLNILFFGFWTFILNWICSKGYEKVSWILVVFPLFVYFFLNLDMFKQIKQEEKGEQQQGEKGEQQQGEQQQGQQQGEKGEQQQGEQPVQPQQALYDSQHVLILNPTPTIHEQHLDPTVYSNQNRQYHSY